LTIVRFLACVLPLLAAGASFAKDAPRKFDVVAPPGHEVEMLDGAAVLRLPGQRYGSVLSYLPESAETGWVSLAVLNTSDHAFRAKTADISAYYGRTALKVHKTSALIRAEQRYRREVIEKSRFAEGESLDSLTWTNRSLERELETLNRPGAPGPLNSEVRNAQYVPATALEREVRKTADAQLAALRARLFPNADIAPGEFSLGDIQVDLPPRRLDQQAEFVLRLDFADEVMEVRFRERSTPVIHVDAPEPTASAD
jgi:hypothetical protein